MSEIKFSTLAELSLVIFMDRDSQIVIFGNKILWQGQIFVENTENHDV